jgi:alpha-tubulin suppressor-like RCC1 family protein
MNGGTVRCWGYNIFGQLGIGSDENTILVPTETAPLSGVAQIGAGWWNTCALMEGGGVRCWGDAEDGQLGDAPFHETPTTVPGTCD